MKFFRDSSIGLSLTLILLKDQAGFLTRYAKDYIMALINLNLYSKCLQRDVPVTCLIPIDVDRMGEGLENEKEPFKSLYLLNGFLEITMIGLWTEMFRCFQQSID